MFTPMLFGGLFGVVRVDLLLDLLQCFVYSIIVITGQTPALGQTCIAHYPNLCCMKLKVLCLHGFRQNSTSFKA